MRIRGLRSPGLGLEAHLLLDLFQGLAGNDARPAGAIIKDLSKVGGLLSKLTSALSERFQGIVYPVGEHSLAVDAPALSGSALLGDVFDFVRVELLVKREDVADLGGGRGRCGADVEDRLPPP